MKGIIGKKIGMTSIFDPSGKQIACTIVEAGPCVISQVKTVESDGYAATQLAFGDKKEKNTTKAEKNHFAKAQSAPKSFVKEFRNYSIEKGLGETITVDIFAEGEKVDVVGTTKGKGFQVLLNVTVSMVLANKAMASTTVSVHRVLSVTLLTLPAFSKACVWQAAWVLTV
jgi:50S ribosomal protein uL3